MAIMKNNSDRPVLKRALIIQRAVEYVLFFQFVRQFMVRRRAYVHELMDKGFSGVLYLSTITTSIRLIEQDTL